ncbi:glycosyltransferase [Membranihabitans maritimus]|uniref:glycosyltransferase n=1 Tax=Membranihabitans maritimus TaxID=2904244 RepID=UPI001F4105A8|nr:glycosyltransferase [Membranihabitans maritimus]
MTRILCIFSGSLGHYKGFDKFVKANDIRNEIIYASNDPKASKTIPKYWHINSHPAYVNHEFLLKIPLMEKLNLKIEDVFYQRRMRDLSQLLDKVKPEVLILDNFNYTDALIVRDLNRYPGLKVLLYQTRLSTALNNSNAYGVPYGKEFRMMKSKKILKIQNRLRRRERWMMPGFSIGYQIPNLFKKFHFQNVTWNQKRYGIPTLSYLPEMVISPIALSTYSAPNQYYMGLGIPHNIKPLKVSKTKNVLVSFGSLSFTFAYTNKYVETIRDLARTFKNLTFFAPRSFEAKVIGSNVEYYDWNTYNQALPRAHIHITLGGINSIKDSLSHGLPMLICPMNLKSDQVHNALLFEKLGMAEVWNLMQDDTDSIRQKIESLLRSGKREVITDFVRQDKLENPPEKLQEVFDTLINDERWAVKHW